MKLGISSYAILGWNFPVNFEAVGQDIPEFAKIVDVISPMAYPATFAPNAYYNPGRDKGSRMYHLVWKTIMGYRELAGPENVHKIRPWIQGYGVTEKNMRTRSRRCLMREPAGSPYGMRAMHTLRRIKRWGRCRYLQPAQLKIENGKWKISKLFAFESLA